MKAIRVRRSYGVTTWHWLTDDEGTVCGRDVADFAIVEETDLEKLPPVEACHGCQRAIAGGDAVQPDYRRDRSNEHVGRGLGGFHYALPATLGRLSKTGPLRKGSGRSGHGNKLR